LLSAGEVTIQRIIIHIDMDAFFASVEQRDHPEYKGKPVVVGGRVEERGVVAAASYEARTYGIRSAMPMAKALKLCPHAVRLPCNFSVYRETSTVVMDILRKVTDQIEPVSIDEAYMDISDKVSGFEEAEQIGKNLKREILRQTRLTASVGVGPNKFLAKVASDHDKPDGFCMVRPEQVPDFLAPLPVRVIPGVGARTEGILHGLNIRTIQDLRAVAAGELQKVLGLKHGYHLYNLARGLDTSAVITNRIRKSLSQERTFSHDLSETSVMKIILKELSHEVAELLEKKKIKGKTVGIKVRFHDFKVCTRAVTLDHYTRDAEEIAEISHLLFDQVELNHRKVRLLGVRLSNLNTNTSTPDYASHSRQMTFWDLE
jgi:DNA polymerase-4